MGADFPMMPRESVLFSRGCKHVSLRGVLCQITAKAFAPQTPWYVLWFMAPQGRSGGEGQKPLIFYALS